MSPDRRPLCLLRNPSLLDDAAPTSKTTGSSPSPATVHMGRNSRSTGSRESKTTFVTSCSPSASKISLTDRQMFEGTYSPPIYTDRYNFLDGAQDDIFEDSYETIPDPSLTALMPVLNATIFGDSASARRRSYNYSRSVLPLLVALIPN